MTVLRTFDDDDAQAPWMCDERYEGMTPLARRRSWEASNGGQAMPKLVDGPWQAPNALEVVSAASFAERAIPPRRSHVPDMIPARNVTLLAGDGATGKSLLALQLAASTALAHEWIGLPVQSGPVLYLSAEDELDELHRRLADIAASYGRHLSELTDLHLVPLAGLDAVLAAPVKGSNVIAPTDLWHRVRDLVARLRPVLIVADTLADLFAGEENQRAQARQFVSMLRGIALEFDTTVVMLAHPSLSGMASGTGSSGSTGWGNSVRSRLYLSRMLTEEKGRAEADPDLRILTSTKANYGRSGGEIRLRWQDGAFVPDGSTPRSSFDRLAANQDADDLFVRLLRLTFSQGRTFSPNPSAAYAPAAFAKMSEANGYTSRALAAAMDRLLAAGTIKIGKIGRRSHEKQVLYVVADQPEGGLQ